MKIIRYYNRPDIKWILVSNNYIANYSAGSHEKVITTNVIGFRKERIKNMWQQLLNFDL